MESAPAAGNLADRRAADPQARCNLALRKSALSKQAVDLVDKFDREHL
jgi:hypothetical protein